MTSFAILTLGAIAGFFVTAGIGSLWADWYRVPNANGGAAYAIVFFALVGGVVGAIVAYVASRSAMVDGTVAFGRGIAYAGAAIGAVALVAIAVLWIGADFPPRLDGRELVVEVEIRTPPMQPALERGGVRPGVMLHGTRGRSAYGSNHADSTKVREDGDRRIVVTRVPLRTSQRDKTLSVTWSPELSFNLPVDLPRKPAKPDFEWSEWRDATNVVTSGGWTAPGSDTRFQGRYRVQFAPPPPKALSRAEVDAQRNAEVTKREQAQYDSLAALPDSTPMSALLEYTQYGVPERTVGLALSMMRQRPDFATEYAELVRHANADTAATWLRLASKFPDDPAPVVEAVRLAGEALATDMETRMPKIPKGDPLGNATYPYLVRFGGWFAATFELREKGHGDFAPEMRRILHASRTRQDLPGMRGDVTRVASFYLHEWAGDAPLPTDPPPR
jgi:hypothetical protein